MTQPGPTGMFDTSLRFDAPGPRGVALANNLRFLTGMAFYALDRLAPFRAQPVVPVTAGNGSIVVALGEDAVKQVYTDNDTFHRAGEGLFHLPKGQPWSGMFEGIITFNGAEHRRRRRLLMPMVHRTALEHYETVFVETFAGSRFATARDGDRFDMVAELMGISKTNMLRCLLGLPDSAANRALADHILALEDAIVRPHVMLMRWNKPWMPYGRWVRRVAGAYYRLAGIIEQRRRDEPAPDALSILCHTTDEDGDRLTTEEIAGELHALLAAGFETTAMTMTWAMVTLLARPSARSVPEEHDPTDPAVIDAVVRESQRVLPAVPMSLPRRVTTDVPIAGSAPVPRGALLFGAALLEHHNADVYPEPTAFRPSRWLAPGFNPKPYEFFPFGIGARRCIGAAFAEAQARTTLGLVHRGELRPSLITTKINYRMKSGVTASPRAPHRRRYAAGGNRHRATCDFGQRHLGLD